MIRQGLMLSVLQSEPTSLKGNIAYGCITISKLYFLINQIYYLVTINHCGFYLLNEAIPDAHPSLVTIFLLFNVLYQNLTLCWSYNYAVLEV